MVRLRSDETSEPFVDFWNLTGFPARSLSYETHRRRLLKTFMGENLPSLPFLLSLPSFSPFPSFIHLSPATAEGCGVWGSA